jgi:DNA polymerase III delta subunit
MIYFFYGSDTDTARAKAHALMDGLLAKKPDASLFKFDADNFNTAEFDALSGSMGLFESNNIIFLDRVMENADAEEALLQRLGEMQESPNVIILLEGEPKKVICDKVGKKAAKAQEFSMRKKVAKPEFNSFALADALGRRDKKELWSLFEEAQFAGKVAEELHGLLFWQMKSMLQAAVSKSAIDAGQKPFVYGKASRFAKNYSLEELKRKSSELVSIYHDARRGGTDMDIALEKFILSL